jgi:dTDP-glucose 4,6-dehydratase
VLVTGITGFIGSTAARKLVEDGHEVSGMLRHVSRSALCPLEPVLDRIRFVEGELGEYHSVRSAILSIAPEAVVHFGALTPVEFSFEDPYPYVRVNFEGTMNVAHAILECSPKTRLIAASTAEVYGWQPHQPTPESAPLSPSSPYAIAKAAADLYLQMAMKVYGLNATILRCTNTYGRHMERGFFVEYAISSMLAGQTVYVGTPTHIRDYMFVDDHVDAYLRVLKDTRSNHHVYNVSPGNPISNIELARRAARTIGFKGKIVEGSYPPGYPERRSSFDTDYIVLDSTRIRTELGWRPSSTVDAGIQRTVDMWTRQQT